MKNAEDVQIEINKVKNKKINYQKIIEEKINDAIISPKYGTYINRYLDDIIDNSLKDDLKSREVFGDNEYPFVIFENLIDYDFLTKYLIKEAKLDDEEKTYLESHLFGYVKNLIQKLVKKSMKKRGFAYQKKRDVYTRQILDIDTAPYRRILPCFVIKPKLKPKLKYGYFLLSILGTICGIMLNFKFLSLRPFSLGAGIVTVVMTVFLLCLEGLFVYGLDMSGEPYLDKLYDQQERLLSLEKRNNK